jgi:hypothetical protein
MPAVQTSYSNRMAAGFAGMPASMVGWDGDSKIVETDAGIGFGLAVSRGTDPKQIVIGGTDFIGITFADNTLLSGQSDKYLDKQLAGVCVRGDIWVVTEDDVAAGDNVEYNATTGQLGSDGGTRIPSARWITSASAGGLAIVRLGDAAAPKDAIA